MHRDSHMSSDKSAVSAPFNSPMMPPAPENSPAQLRSVADDSFLSPFLLTAPPDVFNSPSVRSIRGTESSRRRPSPFPHFPEHANKKPKLNSVDLPDSGHSPSEADSPPPSVTYSTPPSQPVLSLLSPIQSPSAEEGLNSMLPQMQSATPELNALLAPKVDSSRVSLSPPQVSTGDPEVKSSVAQYLCSPGSSPTTSSLPVSEHESPSDQVSTETSSPSSSFSPLEGSPAPEAHLEIPILPESPASLPSPIDRSPSPDELSFPALSQELAESQTCNSPASLSSTDKLPESKVDSNSTLPASATDLTSSDSSVAEKMSVDQDSEKPAESADTDLTESSAQADKVCCVTDASCSSYKGTVTYMNNFLIGFRLLSGNCI